MINKNDVEHIAELAHLKIEEEEKEEFTRQLGDIINYVEKLSELETDEVVPTAYTVPMKNVLREDKVEPSLDREKAVASAPDRKNGQFKVPKIIGE
ncbi:MAG: Asp-tRNA(Asn)/Glu-tRNA(Gln) amidotransferase subunit GatC [Halothermotrichaceae bacterium]